MGAFCRSSCAMQIRSVPVYPGLRSLASGSSHQHGLHADGAQIHKCRALSGISSNESSTPGMSFIHKHPHEQGCNPSVYRIWCRPGHMLSDT